MSEKRKTRNVEAAVIQLIRAAREIVEADEEYRRATQPVAGQQGRSRRARARRTGAGAKP